MRKFGFIICFLLAGPAANAQSLEKFGSMISDQAARDAIELALTQIHKAQCEQNKPCAGAKPEEFKKPPITIIDGRAAMAFAIQSALARWCGLDGLRAFVPMIAFGKQKLKMSDRQMQLMTLIYGDFQKRQYDFYVKSGKQCPDTLRTQLDAELPKLRG